MSPEYRATLRRSQIFDSSNTRNRHPLRLVSLLLAVLSICLTIAIVGTAANVYNVYSVQRAANSPWWLPLWPDFFETSGVKSLIGAGVGIIVFNGLFVAMCLVPKLHFTAESFRAMVTAVTMSSVSALLATISVVFNAIVNAPGRDKTSLQTWTCRFDTGISTSSVFKDLSTDLTNDKFGTLCAQSKFAFWGMVIVLGLQAALFAVAITQWAISFWRRTTRSLERSDSATELGSTKMSEEFVQKH